MFAFARSVVLKEKLGNEGLIELDSALDEVGQRWRNQTLETAADRFERRLTQEMSALRVEVANEFSAVRMEIAAFRLSIIRWVAGLLIAQAGVIIGTVFAMMTFLVNALRP